MALNGEAAASIALSILEKAVLKISAAIKQMLEQKRTEPVYKVKDLIYRTKFNPEIIIGAGGAAAGLVPFVVEKL